MNAPWWPAGAPYRPQKIGELATFELAGLIRFAESASPAVAEGERLAEFLGALHAEVAERAEYARLFAGHAQAGKPGRP